MGFVEKKGPSLYQNVTLFIMSSCTWILFKKKFKKCLDDHTFSESDDEFIQNIFEELSNFKYTKFESNKEKIQENAPNKNEQIKKMFEDSISIQYGTLLLSRQPHGDNEIRLENVSDQKKTRWTGH